MGGNNLAKRLRSKQSSCCKGLKRINSSPHPPPPTPLLVVVGRFMQGLYAIIQRFKKPTQLSLGVGCCQGCQPDYLPAHLECPFLLPLTEGTTFHIFLLLLRRDTTPHGLLTVLRMSESTCWRGHCSTNRAWGGNHICVPTICVTYSTIY